MTFRVNGPAIRAAMKRDGMQQKRLAALVGVSQPTISNWIAGRQKANASRIAALARYTGLTAEMVVAHPDPEPEGVPPCD